MRGEELTPLTHLKSQPRHCALSPPGAPRDARVAGTPSRGEGISGTSRQTKEIP